MEMISKILSLLVISTILTYIVLAESSTEVREDMMGESIGMGEFRDFGEESNEEYNNYDYDIHGDYESEEKYYEDENKEGVFYYGHSGFMPMYYPPPSYEGYSEKEMLFPVIFEYIGDYIEPREIKEYCNNPNEIANIIITKLKEKIGDIKNICGKIEEKTEKCLEHSKKLCGQVGLPIVRDGSSELEKLESVAYSCPVNKDAIINACKVRSKKQIGIQLKSILDSCEKRFSHEGEFLLKECERFKREQVCEREEFLQKCFEHLGIKKEDLDDEKNKKQCPDYQLAECKDGEVIHQGLDGNGCPYYYCSQPTVIECKDVQKPSCNAYERIETYYDITGCVGSYQCIKYQVICPEIEKPKCYDTQSLTIKTDEKGCIVGYECVTIHKENVVTASSITGSAVLTSTSSYEDYLNYCEDSWINQEKICSNIKDKCNKESFVEKCRETEKLNHEGVLLRIDQNCETRISAKVSISEQRCNRIEEDRKKCNEYSDKWCNRLSVISERCKEIDEEKIRNFVVNEVKKKCKFVEIIKYQDDISKIDKVEILLAILNTATKEDLEKLDIFVDNLHEELKLQDTSVYKGTINPNNFDDIKLFPFVVDAKISNVIGPESKDEKARVIKSTAAKLSSLRDTVMPSEYLYIIEDKASQVLDVSDKLEEIEKKEEEKGFGYKIMLFLGMAQKAESEEISQLIVSKGKLMETTTALQTIIDQVPSDVAKVVLKEQVEELKKQLEEIDNLIKAKEKKAKGLFGVFS